jgi:hypothetical protein
MNPRQRVKSRRWTLSPDASRTLDCRRAARLCRQIGGTGWSKADRATLRWIKLGGAFGALKHRHDAICTMRHARV